MKALVVKLKNSAVALADDNPMMLTFVPVTGEWVSVTLSTAKAQALAPMLGLPTNAGFAETIYQPKTAGAPLDAANPLFRVSSAELTNSQQVLEYIEANVTSYASQLMDAIGALIPDAPQ